MDTTSGPPTRLLEEPIPQPSTTTPKIFSNADDAVTVQGAQALQKSPRQTRGLDYSLRALLAGGLAGCAVRHKPKEQRTSAN
jgi:hypothetical protein